jgi:homoserine acetyltransferase
MDDIVIVSAARTPVGSFNGALSSLNAQALGAFALSAAFSRAGIEAADVDEVILGHVLSAGEGQNPARNINDQYAIEKWLDDRGQARARTSDANSFIYMVRANQLFLNEYPSYEAALARAPHRWLVIPSPTDRVFLPEAMREMVEALRKGGKAVQQAEVRGPLGHLNGVVGMAPLAEQIRAFINN